MNRANFVAGLKPNRVKDLHDSELIDERIWEWNGERTSKCKMGLYRGHDGFLIAVATELSDNPGPSITNAAETLWTSVKNMYPNVQLFLETYDGEVYDEVFLENGTAAWTRYE